MESRAPPLHTGSSVVSVQELAKEAMEAVPERYVRHDQEPQIFSFSGNGSTETPVVPIIDLGKLSLDQTAGDHELQKLHEACKDLGLFQLVNHGIGPSLLEDLRHEIEEFFKLPLSEKTKFGVKPGEFEGYGSAPRSEGKLDWGDRFFMIVNPVAKRRPHLFPELPLSLRNTLDSYIKATQKLAMQMLRLISKLLGMEMNEMKDLFEDGFQTMRMTYYPPCPQPELVVGLTPHSDATGITILHQINGVDGFQIERGGVWTPIHILPHALVVNVGDTMEILSNGLYNSIEHRATVNSTRERISIAMFFNPKLDSEIGPIRSLTTAENPALFRRITTEKYVKDFFSHELNGKSYLERIKLQPEKAVARQA
ncbi:codeine O-demethylase-like [Rhodamnia argentea]|uniref:Codeine O-demethylase-like n=1 Tax=Rhodamnia argentea TaxID=178133 RepID=A0A8B8R3P0_9MYRT|nr:codeine O-demethylase-like [Rhodamnia argentea]